MATQKINMSRTEAEHTQAWEEGTQEEYDLPAEPDFTDEATDVCHNCGEPLGWHEQACEVPATKPADEVIHEAPVLQASSDGFTFALGSLALPLTQEQPHPVVWRGHLKERHHATGLVQRVPVYQLADGYWDCYREEELRVA
jgi:hypothetical protein